MGDMESLTVLDMQYCNNLKELWKGRKILNRLKILDLSHSSNLIKTPNLHSSSLEKLILKGCSSLVEVHQSIGNLTSLVFLNLEGCWSLKTLPESIDNVKSLETLNISRCSQLEKLPECMGDMESLTEPLVDGIENEQFLSSIGQLKHVRRLSWRGYSSAPPSCSLISASVSNLKRWLPTSFIKWISVKHLELFNGGLSDRAINCVDFSGLSALEVLDLKGNKLSSLPSGISFLPKLRSLVVKTCEYLVSISDLPSSLSFLDASYCKSLERVRIPIESKTLCVNIFKCLSLEEIQGIEGLNNSFWNVSVAPGHSPNKLQKSVVEVLCVVEAMCNRGHGYRINFSLEHHELHEMPDWMSYKGEGGSLSFHIPPVFHGLVLWLEKGIHLYTHTNIIIIIRNKSNGRILFRDKQAQIGIHIFMEGWLRYISRSEMAMENYCEDDELELYIYSQPSEHAVRNRRPFEPVHVKECGVHVIAGKPDSFEESEVGRDTMMPSPPPYHLLLHPTCGSITASTPKQWSDFLFAKLQGHSLNIMLEGYKRLELT